MSLCAHFLNMEFKMNIKKIFAATVVTLAAGGALAANQMPHPQISAPKIDSNMAISGGFAGGATMNNAALEVGYTSLGGTLVQSPQMNVGTNTATQGSGVAISTGTGSAVFSLGSFAAAGVNNITLPNIHPVH